MNIVFYIAAIVAIVSTILAITRLNAVHALLYLIVSLLSVAIVFFVIGAPFVAALEVIIYAGAIMVLFVFVVMMLNLGKAATDMERQWQRGAMWIGPSILAAILIAEVAYLVSSPSTAIYGSAVVGPKEVGIVLFGPYLIGVELASMLLLGALVGAYHLGRRTPQKTENRNGISTHASGTAPGGDLVRAGTDRPSGAA
jgi:NADH-quinone oxidoreductase subunit J